MISPYWSTTHPYQLTPQNALPLFERFDVILDCTDQPMTRYLISDSAVLTRKPLISASALKAEGQLMLLNFPTGDPSSSVSPTRLLHLKKLTISVQVLLSMRVPEPASARECHNLWRGRSPRTCRWDDGRPYGSPSNEGPTATSTLPTCTSSIAVVVFSFQPSVIS